MFSWLARFAAACIQPVLRYRRSNRDEEDQADRLLWYRDLCQHSAGDFSCAVVQANEIIEDHSQVETSPKGTFVGVYDGHGGPDASVFLLNHLFPNFMRAAQESGGINEAVIQNAFSATESDFLAYVRNTRGVKPLIAASGSCCLVGVIYDRMMYVANLGDSRCILGSISRSGHIVAEQLTKDHNASMEEVRQELRTLHPDDSQIVVLKHSVWRVKGIIQVSRSIGDAYLKSPEFALDPSYARFRLPEPLRRPVLSAEPYLISRAIRPQDKFLVFASDGLWEHLSNQEVADIVHQSPRRGVARKLIRVALHEAARKREMRYPDLKRVDRGIRRFFHDDISVVVLFIDYELLGKERGTSIPSLSVKGFFDTTSTSDFSLLGNNNNNATSITRHNNSNHS